MFATIIQSNGVASGIRQTAVIPNPTDLDEPLVFTRGLGGTTKMRGSAGAWFSVSRAGRKDLLELVAFDNEVVLGAPVSVAITTNDELDIYNGEKPTTLLQKLARAVQSQSVPTNNCVEVLTEVFNTADHKPVHLARYTKGQAFSAPSAPSVSLTREETPITIPAEPVAPAVAPAPAVATESGGVERVYASLVVPPKPAIHIERVFDDIPEVECLVRGLKNGENFLFSGEAGVGKTQVATNLAHHLNLPLVRLEMDMAITRAETEGRQLQVNGKWTWHYSRFATGIKNGAVILLNEINRTLPANATLLLGVLQERQLQIESLNEVIPVHPDCVFIADQNVGVGYATRDMDKALFDRFGTKLEFDDDPAIESQLIPSPALLEIAHALRFLHKQEPAKHRTRVGLRMLLNFVKHTRLYNFKFAVNRFIANFPEQERESVALQFEARHINIAQELGVELGTYNQ